MEQIHEDIQKTHSHIDPRKSAEEIGTQPTLSNYIENCDMPLDIGFCALTVILKIIPIVFFFTTTRIRILGFTLVLFAAAIDFWFNKNLIGRKLVSMMWWMKVNPETGEEEWIFMSNQGFNPHHINEIIFWGCSLGGSIFWGITLLLCILLSTLFWISLCAFCLLLGLVNFAFFMRCRGNHREKFQAMADRVGLGSAHSLVDFT